MVRSYRNKLKKNKSSFIDLDFNKLFTLSDKAIKNKLLKGFVKKEYSPSKVNVAMNKLKMHLSYELNVYGLDSNNNMVQIGQIKDFNKLTPKEIYNKYFLAFYDWATNSAFVDKSGNFRAWKEKVESLSKKNEFMNPGVPTEFKVRIHINN